MIDVSFLAQAQRSVPSVRTWASVDASKDGVRELESICASLNLYVFCEREKRGRGNIEITHLRTVMAKFL